MGKRKVFLLGDCNPSDPKRFSQHQILVFKEGNIVKLPGLPDYKRRNEMKESEVIIFVDRNPDTTPDKVKEFVCNRIKDPESQRKFEVVGLSRLAGSYQCQGRSQDHFNVIELLRRQYGLWI